MRLRQGISVIAAMAWIVSAAPAAAQAAPASPNAQNAKPRDPNEVVCEKQEVVGSRLGYTRVCKTRAEWAEQRRQDRMDIEHVQTQRGCHDSGC
jgi:invasion protein IalB